MTTRLDIAMGIDANYAPHAAAVISSVARRSSPCRFIMLHAGIDFDMQKRVESAASEQTFVWIEVADGDVPAFADRHHFTRAVLFRLGLEKLAPPDCERIIFLDADIAVLADVRPLLTTDLAGAPIGAVSDPNVDASAFAKTWSLSGAPRYFNAGILVIDLQRVRAERLFSKAISFLAEHGAALPWNDQDALNWACWGRWKEISSVWNVQRTAAIESAKRLRNAEMRGAAYKPKIIHYTGAEKPWIAGAYHPWSWLYWRSLARTPFTSDVAAKHGVMPTERAKLFARFVRRWPWLGA